MPRSGVLDRSALIFGQMNEPPRAGGRLTALTIAEYFRDKKRQNVLLLNCAYFALNQIGFGALPYNNVVATAPAQRGKFDEMKAASNNAMRVA